LTGRLLAERYLIKDRCEQTSNNASYRAYHVGIDRSVLLRILPARGAVTRDACRRALAAAEKVNPVPSPHLARTLDVGLLAGRWPFVVSEYSKGKTLEAVLDSTGPLDLRRLLPIARQLASALEMSHRAGIAHGSLGLENLWLESLECRPEWVRILGFGLAEVCGAEVDAPSSGVFMSSVRSGKAQTSGCASADIRGDIYALGASLHQLASGSRQAWTVSEVLGVLDSDFVDSSWTGQRALVRGFSMIVRRCLYLLPDSNYESMAQVHRDLRRLEQTASAIAGAPAKSSRPFTAVHRPARRVRGLRLAEPKVIVRAG
jgi:eukaryotic-like serine/threonine-protein kinase